MPSKRLLEIESKLDFISKELGRDDIGTARRRELMELEDVFMFKLQREIGIEPEILDDRYSPK